MRSCMKESDIQVISPGEPWVKFAQNHEGINDKALPAGTLEPRKAG